MPDTFTPCRTVHRWFARLRRDGTWEAINHYLVMRERTVREASPAAAVLDSQSVKTTESWGILAYDAGKKTKTARKNLSSGRFRTPQNDKARIEIAWLPRRHEAAWGWHWKSALVVPPDTGSASLADEAKSLVSGGRLDVGFVPTDRRDPAQGAMLRRRLV